MLTRPFTITLATPASTTTLETSTYPLLAPLHSWRWRRAYGLSRRGDDAGEIWCTEDEVEEVVARLVDELGAKVLPRETGLAMSRYDD